mmetsp:Transcript_4287/g.13869  ORF Transcript_4287/g.13869 Transcript_4287/m.13869 type:complete len:205 (-) Transcript_4287:109-723(-)
MCPAPPPTPARTPCPPPLPPPLAVAAAAPVATSRTAARWLAPSWAQRTATSARAMRWVSCCSPPRRCTPPRTRPPQWVAAWAAGAPAWPCWPSCSPSPSCRCCLPLPPARGRRRWTWCAAGPSPSWRPPPRSAPLCPAGRTPLRLGAQAMPSVPMRMPPEAGCWATERWLEACTAAGAHSRPLTRSAPPRSGWPSPACFWWVWL